MLVTIPNVLARICQLDAPPDLAPVAHCRLVLVCPVSSSHILPGTKHDTELGTVLHSRAIQVGYSRGDEGRLDPKAESGYRPCQTRDSAEYANCNLVAPRPQQSSDDNRGES